MSNPSSSYLTVVNQHEIVLNGWKDFKIERGYDLTNDGKMIQDPPPKIRHDLSHKLRWNLFGPLEDIRVMDALDDNKYELLPFHDHPLASEPISTASYNQLHVHIDPVEERILHLELDYDDEDRWTGPEPLILQNSQESPITFNRFVTAVHEYFNDEENKSEIMECINMLYHGPPVDHGGGLYSVGVEADGTWPPPNRIPEGTAFVFSDISDSGEPDEGEWNVTVGVFTEGEFGTSLEIFWEQQMGSQKQYELDRQHYDI